MDRRCQNCQPPPKNIPTAIMNQFMTQHIRQTAFCQGCFRQNQHRSYHPHDHRRNCRRCFADPQTFWHACQLHGLSCAADISAKAKIACQSVSKAPQSPQYPKDCQHIPPRNGRQSCFFRKRQDFSRWCFNGIHRDRLFCHSLFRWKGYCLHHLFFLHRLHKGRHFHGNRHHHH